MSFRTIAAIVVVLVCQAVPSAAQGVSIRFADGLVTVIAQDAPLRQILAEWARLGGTTFVNADRVVGTPVTLELQNVTERQALDVLLRNVSGYMVAAREVRGLAASSFDRILIVPTSTAPRPSPTAFVPPPAAPPIRQNQQQFQVGQQPAQQFVVDQDDSDQNPADDASAEPGANRAANPRVRIVNPPGVNPPGVNQPGVNQPGVAGVVVPPAGGRPLPPQPFQPAPDDDDDAEPKPTTPPPANNPFGVQPGSARPGVITPVPRQPQNQNGEPRANPEP